MHRFLVPALALASLAASPVSADGHVAATAIATFIDADSREIGTATLTEGPNGVLIHLRVEGLAPGNHGLHLHANGTCATETGFKSAEGHVGKTEGGHGLLNPDGPEPGDLPNLFVAENGVGEMEAFTTLVSLTEGEANLLDADGSSFIIHEAADDHLSQPIGGAGGRVACGTIASG